jgi:hypothetical protein
MTQLLKIGDRYNGGVVTSITKYGVLTRQKKYERLYALADVAAEQAKRVRVRVTKKKKASV